MEIPKQLFIEDLTPEQIKIIEARMRPGHASVAGFLGDTQSLREVIEADTKVLNDLGITHKQVGDRLDSLMGQAFRQWELATRAGKDYFNARDKGALVDDFLRVSAVGWMGSQECPWFYETEPTIEYRYRVYCCGYGSHDFTVRNERKGTEIEFPQLMSHLVRDHHFFEGKTKYRLNPEDAVKVLELKPGIDYTPKTETEMLWRNGNSTTDVNDNDFCGSKEIKESADRVIEAAGGAKIYLAGDKGLIVANENIDFAGKLMIDDVEVMTLGNKIWRGQQHIEKIKHKYVVG